MRAFVNGLPSANPADPFTQNASFFYDQQPEDLALSYLEVYGGSLQKSNFPGLAADFAAFGVVSAETLSAAQAQVVSYLIVGPSSSLPARAGAVTGSERIPTQGFLWVDGNADIESTLFLPVIHSHKVLAGGTYNNYAGNGVIGAAALAPVPDTWDLFGTVAP